MNIKMKNDSENSFTTEASKHIPSDFSICQYLHLEG